MKPFDGGGNNRGSAGGGIMVAGMRPGPCSPARRVLAIFSNVGGAMAWTFASQRLPVALSARLITLEPASATVLGLLVHRRWPSVGRSRRHGGAADRRHPCRRHLYPGCGWFRQACPGLIGLSRPGRSSVFVVAVRAQGQFAPAVELGLHAGDFLIGGLDGKGSGQERSGGAGSLARRTMASASFTGSPACNPLRVSKAVRSATRRSA